MWHFTAGELSSGVNGGFHVHRRWGLTPINTITVIFHYSDNMHPQKARSLRINKT